MSFISSIVATQYRLHNSLITLSPVIDTLIALSSTALTNIRDAVSEASLVILSECVVLLNDLSERNALLQQQLTPLQKAKQANSAQSKQISANINDNKKVDFNNNHNDKITSVANCSDFDTGQ